MRRLKVVYFLIFSCFFTVSCVDGEVHTSTLDYLIFGHFYGECMGDSCVEIFKLEDNRLSEDTKDQYPSSADFYRGTYVPLSDEQYELARDLNRYFPHQLLEEEGRVIGQPDAGDWGGLYIEYGYQGERQFWLIDQKKSNLPEYLHVFRDKVNEKIALINGWSE